MLSQVLGSFRVHDPDSGSSGCKRGQLVSFPIARSICTGGKTSAIQPDAIVALQIVQQAAYVVGDAMQGSKVHLMNAAGRGLMILDGIIDRPEELPGTQVFRTQCLDQAKAIEARRTYLLLRYWLCARHDNRRHTH